MIRLHTYWRSTASYRVRIALALKGVEHELVSHDLLTGKQHAPDYLALNPQGLLPALETDDGVLAQSLAIIEWLEECFPEPALLPASPADRAIVRAMAYTICCDVHPLNNLRVLQSLRGGLGASEENMKEWIAHWIALGFGALEQQIVRYGGACSFGDTPTLADCCLIPQVYSAERFAVDLDPYPAIRSVAAYCAEIQAFRDSHPSVQPGAV